MEWTKEKKRFLLVSDSLLQQQCYIQKYPLMMFQELWNQQLNLSYFLQSFASSFFEQPNKWQKCFILGTFCSKPLLVMDPPLAYILPSIWSFHSTVTLFQVILSHDIATWGSFLRNLTVHLFIDHYLKKFIIKIPLSMHTVWPMFEHHFCSLRQISHNFHHLHVSWWHGPWYQGNILSMKSHPSKL